MPQTETDLKIESAEFQHKSVNKFSEKEFEVVYILRKRGQMLFYFNYIFTGNKIKLLQHILPREQGEMSIKFVD